MQIVDGIRGDSVIRQQFFLLAGYPCTRPKGLNKNLIATEAQPVKNGCATTSCNLDRLVYSMKSTSTGTPKGRDVRNNLLFHLVTKNTIRTR